MHYDLIAGPKTVRMIEEIWRRYYDQLEARRRVRARMSPDELARDDRREARRTSLRLQRNCEPLPLPGTPDFKEHYQWPNARRYIEDNWVLRFNVPTRLKGTLSGS